MANAAFYFWNWWAYPRGAVSASSAAPGDQFAVENTLRQTGDLIWRTTGVSSQWISRDFGTSHKIDSVALVGHNLSPAATWRIRAGDDPAFGTNLLDQSGIVAWEPVFGLEEILEGQNSEYFDLFGYPTLATRQTLLQKAIAIFDISVPIIARYLRIDFLDPTNPAGFFQIEELYAGTKYIPERGVSYGASRYRSDTVRRAQASSGQYWFGTTILKRIILDLKVELESHQNIMQVWALFLTLLGNRRTFLIRIFGKEFGFRGSAQFYHTLHCRFLRVPQMKNTSFERYTIPITIEEML